jgi:hypothetical protein
MGRPHPGEIVVTQFRILTVRAVAGGLAALALAASATDNGAKWTSLANLANTNLEKDENVRFGVRMSRDGMAGTADLTDSRCQLRALIYSRTGAASPI